MRFSGFESLLDRAKSFGRAKVAVAAAAEKEVLGAIKLAQYEGLISPILVVDVLEIKRLAKEIGFSLKEVELIHEPNLFINSLNFAILENILRKKCSQKFIKKVVYTLILSLIHISEPTRLGMISYAV